jgi:hypothetical protein
MQALYESDTCGHPIMNYITRQDERRNDPEQRSGIGLGGMSTKLPLACRGKNYVIVIPTSSSNATFLSVLPLSISISSCFSTLNRCGGWLLEGVDDDKGASKETSST